MQISQKLSIAVHCLVFIHKSQVKVTSMILSASTGINPVIIRNLLSSLKKAGIITVARGTGGARLTRQPQDISLYDVFVAVEGNERSGLIGIHACKNNMCPIARNIGFALERQYIQVEDAVIQKLKTLTLQNVIDDMELYDQKNNQAQNQAEKIKNN